MKHIYWKGVKRKIDKFFERIIDCIIIFSVEKGKITIIGIESIKAVRIN